MIYALDLETRDPGIKERGPGWPFDDGYPVGYALAWHEDGNIRSEYLPVRHSAGGNLEMSVVRERLLPILGNPDNVVVMANSHYDYSWALADGFDWKAQIEDVQIIAPLLDDQRRSISLEALGKDFLGRGKNEGGLWDAAREWGLRDPKANMWRLPAPDVEQYARSDAELTLELHGILYPKIREMDLERVYRMELELVPLLHRMRKRGVRVDTQGAVEMRDTFLEHESDNQKWLERVADTTVDPWNSREIVQVLRNLGVREFPVTEKTGENSINREFLRGLSKNRDAKISAAAEAILNIRRYNKARVTFIENMIMDHAHNGRIHGQINPLFNETGGTVTGRFSMATPNLQQVPARDEEIGPMVRGLFLPEEGETWCSIDYASQEPRLAVHFGCAAGLHQARKMADAYNADPRMDPYADVMELCGISRFAAKTIRLGILYGLGGGSMCRALGLPTEPGRFRGRDVLFAGPEGKALLDRYHEASPMDRQLFKMAKERAETRGHVRTIMGRRSSFPKQENGERWFTYKALNRIIQGSAADMTKRAMLNCADAGHDPLLTVHDELCFSLGDAGDAEALAEIMSNSISLEVPVVCDVETGATWGASMEKENKGASDAGG